MRHIPHSGVARDFSPATNQSSAGDTPRQTQSNGTSCPGKRPNGGRNDSAGLLEARRGSGWLVIPNARRVAAMRRGGSKGAKASFIPDSAPRHPGYLFIDGQPLIVMLKREALGVQRGTADGIAFAFVKPPPQTRKREKSRCSWSPCGSNVARPGRVTYPANSSPRGRPGFFPALRAAANPETGPGCAGHGSFPRPPDTV